MHPAVQQAVRYQLGTMFERVESGQNVLISPTLRSFMADVVFESLEVRENEWKKRGLDPNNPDSSSQIASQVSNVVQALTAESETYGLAAGQRRVLLIGFLQAAHKNWCGIFPFCR